MPEINLKRIEQATFEQLKDFQRATVERIDELFRNGQYRVLVADEVGMGKTLIARGVMIKTACRQMRNGKKSFKVVYVCSNQNIAGQNIRKLDITGEASIEKISDTRLSMQHLKLAEQEWTVQKKDKDIRLIPLTPETSFRMTSGRGSVKERALIFAVLRRMDEFKNRRLCRDLEDFMKFNARKSWEGEKEHIEWRVKRCWQISGGRYPENIITKIQKNKEFAPIKEMLLNHLQERRLQKPLTCSDQYIINKLRILFAQISAAMLKPDLVIMDEFQRFHYLFSPDEGELDIVSRCFLHKGKTKILLLSATPYKLYSTLEEIEQNPSEEHYKEFYQVMDFLFKGRESEFHSVWEDYSAALSELKTGDQTILTLKKKAENALYEGVCRTERISVMESGDYTDDSSADCPLPIQAEDIQSYLQLGQLMADAGINQHPPEDYIKSCPFLLSFMRDYQLKKQINDYAEQNPDKAEQANKPLLWLNREQINQYDKLPKTNARLEALKEKAFVNGAEMYLWVPPSKPYYPLQGVYKDSREFSKILVFSSWKMVPGMIGAMLSYEAERRTVGKLSRRVKNKKNACYFAEKSRYPVSRLHFSVLAGKVRGMSLFCLIYPSRTLADIYNPIECLNQSNTLSEIEEKIRSRLEKKLEQLEKVYGLPFQTNAKNADKRWFYLAPMLMDGADFAADWVSAASSEENMQDELSEKGRKGFLACIRHLNRYLNHLEDIHLGKRPDDLLDILVNMTLGSPAVCIFRSNGREAEKATELAKIFVNHFNLTESTAIIDLAYGRSKEDAHWKNVLRYCKDGCFSSMFDEYLHLINETVRFSAEKERPALIHRKMVNSLRIHTSTYTIDTFSAFKQRAEKKEEEKITRIRLNYAVNFAKDTMDNTASANRKESVQNAFNSPLRPFVLATTAVGQEGLDFHFYCRKIMHWNLPANPIDLEQREGRINRFKCLAVRQNVADNYGNIHFSSNIWEEMFEAAEAEKQEHQSELVPCWCFGRNQTIKIERIVPLYPISRDEVHYQRLIKILSLYRLTLGQARQEELLEYLLLQTEDVSELKNLFIDLSPFSKFCQKEKIVRR